MKLDMKHEKKVKPSSVSRGGEVYAGLRRKGRMA
jgi:hypothetical protein